MPTFQSNKYRSNTDVNRFGQRYRAVMNRHPFLAFGLPFIAVIISGSFVLTPATAVRYERYDRKVRQMTKEEELNVRRSPRKVDMKEEYYVSIIYKIDPVERKNGRLLVKDNVVGDESDPLLTRIQYRGLRRETWTTGSRKESSDYQANEMVFSELS